MLVTALLLGSACGPAAATPPPAPSVVAPVHAHVSRDRAEKYAAGLAKAVWEDLQRLPRDRAMANISSQLQLFSNMTGCSIVADRPRRFSASEHRDFVRSVHLSVLVAVKCP